MIHCKLYHFLYQKYWQCSLDSSLPLGQAALKFSLLQQLLINFTFLTTNHLPGPLIFRQVFLWMKSFLPGRKFYLSWMTGQQFFQALTVGHSQDLFVNKLKYSASSDILCLTELLAIIIKGSILLLFSYLFC